MKCLLVFDSLNDLIFLKCNNRFARHIEGLAKAQGLLKDELEPEDTALNPNVVMQLFSPLITSQRIMINHFSNAYSTITCFDGLTVMFDEYIGYLFVIIGYASQYWLKRHLGAFISVTKHVCGPDISTLKSCEKNFKLVSSIMDSWYRLACSEQSILVEAIEQLRINGQVATACIKALMEATEKLKSSLSYSHVHALIMVNHRFLSLYSTRSASELSSNDILFLSLVGEVTEHGIFERQNSIIPFMTVNNDSDDTDDEETETGERFYSPNDSKDSDSVSVKSCIPVDSEDADTSAAELYSNFLFLLSKQKPHGVHISYMATNIPIFLIYEVGNEILNGYILEALLSLCSLQDLQVRGTTDREVIHSAVDSVENGMKKLSEALKKKSLSSNLNRVHSNTIKSIIKKWEPIRKNYQDYLKSHNAELLQKIDSSIESVASLLRGLHSACIMNNALVSINHDIILPVLHNIRKSLSVFTDMFKNKIPRNLTLGTKSTLSINKYLEEFPGLVHFLYIDRSNHRFVGPNLDFSSQETTELTKGKVWKMVEFARKHLEEGITSLMWKDTIFCYSYFLWFEDFSGTPLKPKTSPAAIIKSLPSCGLMDEDFYGKLLKKCFLSSSHKVRCFELFSVHLGLVTSACVLEQCRRLTATIWEVTGVSTNPLDLL